MYRIVHFGEAKLTQDISSQFFLNIPFFSVWNFIWLVWVDACATMQQQFCMRLG